MTISHKMMSYDECGKVVHRERERERENSVFVYCNKQAGAKMWWVRYIVVNY